jgi:PAS domain S-box-containing protein
MLAIPQDRVNILLVDDQPAKLLSYEVILGELNETLLKASNAREALEHLLRTDVAVILIDVCMPELDGFELAQMIREHPRFQRTAIIFVSAIHLSEIDRLRGYEAGAVDYVPVPVVPQVLRAKVKVFIELYRKTRELEILNAELERRVAERTSELEAAAARLRQSEERRSLALAAGQMGSWDWDISAGTLICDDGQCRILGLSRSEEALRIETMRQFIHPDDLETICQVIASSELGQRTFQVEARLLHSSGETRWCICAGAVTPDGTGAAKRVSGVTIDITGRKKTERSLQQLNEELEKRIDERTREREHALAQLFEAQKLDTIGQLTGGVAHDFNNLLMAVLASLQLLRKRLPDDQRLLRLIDNALQGAERGAALTQRLLAFARRQELRPVTVHVGTLVDNMEDLLRRALGPAIALKKHIPDDLPYVLVDSNQLELALLNLAINARDAMPLGGELEILASQETIEGSMARKAGLQPGAYVCISVKDEGEGMDEATLAKAAEPFFTTKGPGKGTGLGLSMVHGLAAQSKGKLRIVSAPGSGTRVELWLPQSFGHVIQMDDASAKIAPIAQTRSANARRILVVDDDLLVCTGTAAMLEDLGYAVVEAHSAEEALIAFKSEQEFDLVITDHVMPGFTGLQLASQIREFSPLIPVVIASGFADWPEDGPPGDWPRISKPYSQDDLAKLINAMCQQR